MADPLTSRNQDLLEEILTELLHIKRQLPNGELKTLMSEMKDVKADISDIKKRILDPEDGIIVKVNKNTHFREESEDCFQDLERDVKSLVTWRGDIVKAVWIIFTAIIGLITNAIFNIV